MTSTRSQASTRSKPGARSKILIIDDDPLVTTLLEELLGQDYDLTIASSGAAGLACAQRDPPDLVLLDVVMPEMDGYATCRAMRAIEQLANVKVLLISGMTQAADRVAGYEAGADDFVLKPFDGGELVAKVRVYLRLKRAEELDRTKTAFLANMSHEIRTPLNAVLGMTELVLDTELTAEQREYLHTVRQSGRALLGIIDDILDWSKMEAGRMDLECVAFDLRAVLTETLRSLGVHSLDKNLELVLDVDGALPEQVCGDPLRLRQVVTNLVGNAIKFTAAGEVVVSVEVVRRQGVSVCVRLQVRDTRIGIEEAAQARLFESFHQADSSTTRRFGGTGLGLAISRRLVQLMGGTLRVASVPGQGSTFTVEVELRAAGGPPPAEFPGAHVLSLDDHPAAARAAQRLFAELGLQVTACVDLTEACAALDAAWRGPHPIAVAVVAAGRSPRDGLAAVDVLRKSHPELPIVVSVPRRLADRVLAGDGVVHQVLRPLGRQELVDVLGPCLRAPAAAAARAAVRHRPARRLRVLIADDNAANQRLVCGLLRRQGHQCVVAHDGAEALALLAADDAYDLVLMDIQMPNLDGLDATQKIRSKEAETGRHIPIVGLTASAFADDRERCLAAGMDAYMAKPFRIAELQALIEHVAGTPADVASRPR